MRRGDGKISSTIYAVYGREFSSTLIPVNYELGHVKVEGYISAPSPSRPNRSMQNFFINGRYIRSRTAMAALEEAYKGSIMVGKFPACVLHMRLSFGAVDVNVHPAKLEVRFVNERPIFDAVYHGVKSALHAGDRPKVMELKQRPAVSPFAPNPEKQEQPRMEIPKTPATFQRAGCKATYSGSETRFPASCCPETPSGRNELPAPTRGQWCTNGNQNLYFPISWKIFWTGNPSRRKGSRR